MKKVIDGLMFDTEKEEAVSYDLNASPTKITSKYKGGVMFKVGDTITIKRFAERANITAKIIEINDLSGMVRLKEKHGVINISRKTLERVGIVRTELKKP